MAALLTDDPRKSDVFFENGRGFHVKTESGRYICMTDSQLKRHFASLGVSTSKNGQPLTPADAMINQIQLRCYVDYVGPLAGKPAGFCIEGGRHVLVTEGLQLPAPMEGESPVIGEICEAVLKDPQYDQLTYFYSWLKVGYEALRDREHIPGQAIAFVGPKGSGKSLLQSVITEVLGGRNAHPYSHLTGKTDFNRELFGAESLVIGDEVSSTDIRARRNLGAMIKQFTVNDFQRCHGKNMEAFSLKPQWRLSMSLNEEPENLLVLPPLDESIKDKLMLFKAFKRKLPIVDDDPVHGRKRLAKAIAGEMGAFVRFLTEFQIPKNLQSPRFRVTHFHHPEVLASVDEFAPELRLLELIDEIVFSGDNRRKIPWEGTAAELERQLLNLQDSLRHSVRSVLSWDKACGSYLGRLAERDDGRVTKRKTKRSAIYTIQLPPREV